MPYLYSDHTKKDFTTGETSYEIGTAWGTKFTSEELCLLSTVDCEIKINDDDDTKWQPVYADDYFTFRRQIDKITFRGISESGTLEIWAEGGEINDQITELQTQLTDVQAQTTNIEKHHVLRRKIVGDHIIYYDELGTTVMKYKMVKDRDDNIIELIPEVI